MSDDRSGLDTFPKLLLHHARVRGERPAIREKDLGIWQTWTWREYADEIRARQLVSERMALATKTLPTWAAPPFMMPPLSSTSRIMKIGITSRDKSVMDLSMLSYWTIRQRLLGVPGVANIAIW